MSIGRSDSAGAADATDARLLSPEAAAAYLGLGSRWAIYRLVSSGSSPQSDLQENCVSIAWISIVLSKVPSRCASCPRARTPR